MALGETTKHDVRVVVAFIAFYGVVAALYVILG